MEEKLISIINENWEYMALAGVVASAIYGFYKCGFGIYKELNIGTNKGLVDLVIGGNVVATSGMACAVFGALSNYLRR